MEGYRARSPKLRMERLWVPRHRHVSWNAWGTANLSIRHWWNSKPPPQPWRNQNSSTFIDPLQAAWRFIWKAFFILHQKNTKRDSFKCRRPESRPYHFDHREAIRIERTASRHRPRYSAQCFSVFLQRCCHFCWPSYVTSMAEEASLKAHIIFTFGSTFKKQKKCVWKKNVEKNATVWSLEKNSCNSRLFPKKKILSKISVAPDSNCQLICIVH